MTRRGRLAIALLLVVAGVTPLAAQDARIERPSQTVVEVIGGSGAGAWRLRYGTVTQARELATITPLAGDRALFVHGPWLRVIDTAAGRVTGRWRFPNFIEGVTVGDGGLVDVRIRLQQWATSRSTTVTFDLNTGNVPAWDVGALLSHRVADAEASALLKSLTNAPEPWLQPIPGAAAAVPVVEDLIARDPSALLLRLAFAKLLLDAGDPRSGAALASLVATPAADFTEWFRAAAALARMPGVPAELALTAFDRGLADFVQKGRDTRWIDTILTRLVLLGAVAPSEAGVDHNFFMDLFYRLAPTSEATERAWAFHAGALAHRGDSANGVALWRARAETSRRESLFPATIDVQRRHDQLKLLFLGSILAALVLIVTRHARYSPQRRMHALAAARSGRSRSSFMGLAYWSRRERRTLLVIAVVAWLASGASWGYARVFFKAFSAPVRAGSISSFEDFARVYPPTPERNLLQAVALQMQGLTADAEPLYRATPQFAESWNNLGVIMAASNRVEESRQAFARALEIDPTLPEAVLNATGQATSYPAEVFQKFVQDGKMVAPPGREHLLTAYLGRIWTQRHLRSMLGPIAAFAAPHDSVTFGHPVIQVPAMIGGVVIVLIMALSLLLVALVPVLDVSVPPGRAVRIWERLIPGLDPAWRWLGGPILVTWLTLLLTVLLQLWLTTPYLLIAVAQPGLMRAFGYDTGPGDLNPPVGLLTGILVALSALNAIVTRRKSD